MRLKGVGRVLSDSRTVAERETKKSKERERERFPFTLYPPPVPNPFTSRFSLPRLRRRASLTSHARCHKCALGYVWACTRVNKNKLACLMASSTRERLHLSHTTRGEHDDADVVSSFLRRLSETRHFERRFLPFWGREGLFLLFIFLFFCERFVCVLVFFCASIMC